MWGNNAPLPWVAGGDFQVEKPGGAGPNGGIDLILRSEGEKHLAQCKQWRAFKVGVQVVWERYGVMAAEGGRQDHARALATRSLRLGKTSCSNQGLRFNQI
jgi:hypothetical protein